MNIKSSNVTVMVRDMDRSVQFYQTIGLELKQRWENHYAQLTAADIVIGLHPTDVDIPSNSKVSIGFMIENIADAKTLLDHLKIPYKHEEGKSGNYTNFNDPDGTYLYFVQPKWK